MSSDDSPLQTVLKVNTTADVVYNFLPYKIFQNECPFWKIWGMKPSGKMPCHYEGIFVLYQFGRQYDPYNICNYLLFA